MKAKIPQHRSFCAREPLENPNTAPYQTFVSRACHHNVLSHKAKTHVHNSQTNMIDFLLLPNGCTRVFVKKNNVVLPSAIVGCMGCGSFFLETLDTPVQNVSKQWVHTSPKNCMAIIFPLDAIGHVSPEHRKNMSACQSVQTSAIKHVNVPHCNKPT